MKILTEIEKSFQKFIWEHKISRIAKAILSNKSNAGDVRMSDFKIRYRGLETRQHAKAAM
jgi:hypothetical protein